MSRGSRSESLLARKRCSPKPSLAPRSMAKVCVGFECCKEVAASSPCSTAADCPECLSSTLPPSSDRSASPCLDSSHISSTCVEPVCSAATSSTTPICAAAVLPCCDGSDCIESPASPCDVSVCEAISPCPAVSANCCSDVACEADTDPVRNFGTAITVCDGMVAEIPCDSHAKPQNKCSDCRGSVDEHQSPNQGRMYSSFQELLDCCCCSMPPAADQCCIGAESRHHEHANGHVAHHAYPNNTPLSAHLSPTPMDIESQPSRSSTVSTALTPPNINSPLTAQTDPLHLFRREIAESPQASSALLLHDFIGDLHSWDGCSFAQPHLHTSQKGCLPPPATLCGSSSCDAPMPHSHWTSVPPLISEQDSRPQSCQWAGCQQRFWTIEELVAHVNHSHLVSRKPVPDVSSAPSPIYSMHSTPQSSIFTDETTQSLSCLWKDCQQVSHPIHVAQSQTMGGSDAWISDPQLLNEKLSFAMLQHLLHDHLGTQASTLTKSNIGHVGPVTGDISESTANVGAKRQRCDSCSGGEEDDSTLRCHWEGCSQVFSNHSQLTDHITRLHVGSGKNEYECRWLGCERHAQGKTFSQKQKVLRHIQTHTGDRPFKCDLCGKRFSEPNTLAQHIRTHTQEKPYVCNFPGCGKAFAVAGSLTIHKRIHSGAKPFICNFPGCGKAFAESSNLTKHVRTHTGHRPFECPECGKGFSRPDQLSRHRKTHERKIHPTPLGLTS